MIRPVSPFPLVVLLVLAGSLAAQPRGPMGGGWRGGNEDDLGGSLVRTEGSGIIDEDLVRTAREVVSHSTGTPNWTIPAAFRKDVFTFARSIFKVGPNLVQGYGRGRRLGWWVDFPDADLNFSYRLQELTSIRADPDGRTLKFSDPALHDYPFILMEHPGYIKLREEEEKGLRRYLLAGGTLVVIDFWGTMEWEGFAAQMKRVMPERGWTDLGFDHPIFHCVYDLKGPMRRLQVPTMQFWNREHDPDSPNPIGPLQIFRGEGSEEMHVRVMYDDKGRISVIAFHNSDLTDGWEREGENADFFEKFSEKISYPLGINLMFYLMTH